MSKNVALWNVKDIVNIANECQEKEFDCIICIDGKRGLGKSTMAWLIGKGVHASFKPWRDVLYSRNDVYKALATYEKGVILADEMIDVAYNREHWDQEQRKLIKTINKNRDKCNILICCVPNFMDLDTQMRRLVKIRITVLRRGLALVQSQLRMVNLTDPWDIAGNFKEELKSFRNNKQAYSKFTTFKGYIKFKKMKEKDEILYKKIKNDKRNKMYEEEQEKEVDPTKEFYDNLVKEIMMFRHNKESFESMCRIVGRNIKTVTNVINERLRQVGSDAAISYYLTSHKTPKVKRSYVNSSKKAVATKEVDTLPEDTTNVLNNIKENIGVLEDVYGNAP